MLASEAQREIRAAVIAALQRAGLDLSPAELAAGRQSVLASGEALFAVALPTQQAGGAPLLRQAARALRLPDAALARTLGHGQQQARLLAERAGALPSLAPEVTRLGALFNLGIALFDGLCDEHPERAALLLREVTPQTLASAAAGRPLPRCGDPAVDLLLILIAEVLAGARRLGGPAALQREFDGAIVTMYQAERLSISARRSTTGPTLVVLRLLRRKSALPIAAVALLAALARPPSCCDQPSLDALRRDARRAGQVLWLIDDLVDVKEDWLADAWSRPLWLWARRGQAPAPTLDGALSALLDTGVIADEAQRLVRLLRALSAPQDPLGLALLAAVWSWLGA